MTVRQTDEGNSKYTDIVPDLDNKDGEYDRVKWVKFESLLEAFVEMIEQNRITALPKDPERWLQRENPNGPDYPGPNKPWYLSEDDRTIVDITISAWDGLLSAIELRLPSKVAQHEQQESHYSVESVDLCNIHGMFVKKFLQRARIPSFKFLAPGLRLASPDELAANQPFGTADLSKLCCNPYTDKMLEPMFKYYPFLFLCADKTILGEEPSIRGEESFRVKYLEGSQCRFRGYPWEFASEFEAGLYLLPSRDIERPDGCKLLLPFPMTPDKWVKLGSGDPLKVWDRYDGLYQPQPGGMSTFIAEGPKDGSSWHLRLELLFRNWTRMIESGYWEVGADGVVGGTEKFKEADSEGKWKLYFIDMTW
jgi:hypothetical protein